jgi:hypothetical protein
MLYTVGWELISWTGSSTYIAELSEEERHDLESFFEREHRENRIIRYQISPFDIKDNSVIRQIYEDDLKAEDESAGGVDG